VGSAEGATWRYATALVCDSIQDPGNLGTLLRTAEAAGVQAVWLSPQCVDLYNPKVVRAAMGAHFRLPTFSCSWDEIRNGLEALGIPDGRVFAAVAEATMPYDRVGLAGGQRLDCSPTKLTASEGGEGFGGWGDKYPDGWRY